MIGERQLTVSDVALNFSGLFRVMVLRPPFTDTCKVLYFPAVLEAV